MLYSYYLSTNNRNSQSFEIPKNATFMSCKMRYGDIALWYKCDDDPDDIIMQKHYFVVMLDNDKAYPKWGSFVDTIVNRADDAYHVYDCGEINPVEAKPKSSIRRPAAVPPRPQPRPIPAEPAHAIDWGTFRGIPIRQDGRIVMDEAGDLAVNNEGDQPFEE